MNVRSTYSWLPAAVIAPVLFSVITLGAPAVQAADLWQSGQAYAAGEHVEYMDIVYEVRQPHTSQTDWTPPQVPALFLVVEQDDGGAGLPVWQAWVDYEAGRRVVHGTAVWEALQGHVSQPDWQPGQTPALWRDVTDDLGNDDVLQDCLQNSPMTPQECFDLWVWKTQVDPLPIPDGEQRWVGDGIDALTGELRHYCFKPTLTVVPTDIKFESSDYTYTRTTKEIRTAFSQKIHAGASASYGLLSGKVDLDTELIEKTEIKNESIVIAGVYRWLDRKVTVGDRFDGFAGTFNDHIRNGQKELFRGRCGDQFVREAVIGGGLNILMSSNSFSIDAERKRSYAGEAQVALGTILDLNADVSVRTAAREFLEQHQTEIHCRQIGGTPGVCSGLSLSNVGERVHQFAEAMRAGNNLVALSQAHENYQVPVEFWPPGGGEPNPWDYFANYEPLLAHIEDWVELDDQLLDRAKRYPSIAEACTDMGRDYVAESIDDCAHTISWPQCRNPHPLPPEWENVCQELIVDINDDVGVVPGPDGSCPVNSEPISFYMDDEDDGNDSLSSGWTGAISQDGNTNLRFCRIDGANFRPLGSTTQVQKELHYAVLKLDVHCPLGAHEAVRYFDNEDDGNENSSSGDIFPNSQDRNTTLRFCVFQHAPSELIPTMDQFPDLGIEYGVIARHLLPQYVLDAGSFYTDDEDEGNENQLYTVPSNADVQLAISRMIDADQNTRVHLRRVR